MRRRVLRSVLGWGWRAAPGWLAYTGAMLVANAITTVLYPVGLALVIDAALAHRADGGPTGDPAVPPGPAAVTRPPAAARPRS